MKIISILNTYQCKKSCWSPSVGQQNNEFLPSEKSQLRSYTVDFYFYFFTLIKNL